MKKFIIIGLILTVVSVACNTDYNYIDSGQSEGVHDCTMYDYLKTDSYNWDSTRLMIDRGGLTALFKGEGEYDRIMFFGPTNHTIRAWLYYNGYKCIADVAPEKCKALMLRHVVTTPLLRKEVPIGENNATLGGGKSGGITLTALGGNKMWFYAIQEPYYGVEGAGPLMLYLESIDNQQEIPIASVDIQTRTGIVHSLHYSYYLEGL